MNPAFEFFQSPTHDLIARASLVQPDDAFLTAGFCEAQRLLGLDPYLFVLRTNQTWQAACLGFMRRGRFSRSLEILSLPNIPFGSPFWGGLLGFCNSFRIWDLSIRSIVPTSSTIDLDAVQLNRKTGVEYRLALCRDRRVSPPSSNHRRSIAKATTLGMQARRTRDLGAVQTHLDLMQSSMGRRVARGEDVPSHLSPRFYEAMLSTGAGEFAQAVRGDVVRSSIFLLRSKSGAYYQSAGTSPEGMDEGASAFLIVETAESLFREGVTLFDLGGACADETGLKRFKSGFGAVENPFEIVTFSTVGSLRRRLRTAINLLRRDPRAAAQQVVAADSSVVYRAAPASVPPPESIAGAIMEKLSEEKLLSCCGPNTEFMRQAARLSELGYNDAHGVFINGELAHVSWLITAEHDRMTPVREIILRNGEAEITHCFTGEKWRGKGIYCFAIRSLCQLAAGMSIRQVFMIAYSRNAASRRGIEKAGLRDCGRVVRMKLPFLFGERALRIRTHRMEYFFNFFDYMNVPRRFKKALRLALLPVTRPWSVPATMIRDLNALGVKRGGILLVHSSLAQFGFVPGGAAVVIRVLQTVVGPEGTLIMPTHTWEWMNKGCRVFNAADTQSCVGRLSDVFRQMHGVLRSLHPTHSVAAKGPLAADIIADHEYSSTPCGNGTPYAKVLDLGGQILLLGCSTEANTCFHTLEARCGFPYLLREEETRFEIIDAGGRSQFISVPLHRDASVRGEPIARRFDEMEDILVEMGVAKRGLIGQAHAVLIEGSGLLEHFKPLLDADPFYLLADRP